MRYRRGISDQALRLWVKEAVPQRLLLPILDSVPGDRCALDMQLREGGVLQVYHGNTSVLRIREKDNGERMSLGFGAYERRVRQLYPELSRDWAIRNVDELGTKLKEVLPRLAGEAGDAYYRNRKEGYWENRLCFRHGRSWTLERDWLALDRQAVIGFDSTEMKEKFYRSIRDKHIVARALLREGQQKRWIEAGPIGDELDILAINGKREIVCVELKHKSNSDLYYGPFQAAVYRDAFVAAASSIAADMERLARQKMALGLLPAAAAPLLAIARPIAVRAMLIVVGQPSKEVMRRLEQSLDSCTGVECLILPDGDTR